jgi:hypothetical protein
MTMKEPHQLYGWLVFFGVPLVLWTIGAGAAFKKGRNSPFFAYIAGSDQRLSLSRAQAFAWTLIIFGAFAAAMTFHNYEAAESYTTAAAELATATRQAEQAKITFDQTAADSPDRDTRRKALDAAIDNQKVQQQKVNSIPHVPFWIDIPAALLMLAGIAIGSGVFSSLIASTTSEEKTACVTGIQSNAIVNPAGGAPTNTLVINGLNLGARGRVRFGRLAATIREWKADGTQIHVNVPPQLDSLKHRPLVVDTSNGKLAYELLGVPDNLVLGQPTSFYEFIDLFRDDKSPDNLDLMKFQMFGWTVIAIVVYSFLFLKRLDPALTALPEVPNSMVILTGLSQTGYLAGKGVSSAK